LATYATINWRWVSYCFEDGIAVKLIAKDICQWWLALWRYRVCRIPIGLAALANCRTQCRLA